MRVRRDALLCVGAALCMCCAGGRQLSAQFIPNGRPFNLADRAACGSEPGDFGSDFWPDPRRLLARSGVGELDSNLPAEVAELNRIFGLRDRGPEFFIYDDRNRNRPIGAKATKDAAGQTRVFLGIHLIHQEIQRNPGLWQNAVIGVLAHEWAHVYQFRTQLERDEPTFIIETHADFLAGWYLGVKAGMGRRIEPDVFARSLFVRGEVGPGFNETLYGSPAQRVDAMRAGFSLGWDQITRRGRLDREFAAQQGYDRVADIARSYRRSAR